MSRSKVTTCLLALCLLLRPVARGHRHLFPPGPSSPAEARPLPEPLAAGQQPGFKLRGIKGWEWTQAQYLEEIPWLAKFKMNFLMNDYASLYTSTQPRINEWWKPLPKAKKAAYAKVIRSCRDHGLNFCFCMNPQLDCKRPLNGANADDLALLFEHYDWAQSQGVKWFCICVDDAGWGGKGPQEAATDDANMANTILGRLREKDPEAQMILCPGPYWGDGHKPDDHAYLQTLGHNLNPDVYIIWTGDDAVTPRITRAAAESYKKAVQHRLILWDNYPVNDKHPTLSLGPVNGRALDLCDVIDGYMSNPMEPQNQINRIPLVTIADYGYNPAAYDPARSIGQAILLFAKTDAQRNTLKELIEAYPGFIVTGGGTGANPVRDKFNKLTREPDAGAAAREFLHEMENLSARFQNGFPGQFDDAKETVAADIAWMNQKLNAQQ